VEEVAAVVVEVRNVEVEVRIVEVEVLIVVVDVAIVEVEVLIVVVDVCTVVVDVARGISHTKENFLEHGASFHPLLDFITTQFSSRLLLLGSPAAQKSVLPSPSKSGDPENAPVPSFHEKSSSSVPMAVRYPPNHTAPVPVSVIAATIEFWSAKV